MADSSNLSPWIKYLIGPLSVTAVAGYFANDWQEKKAQGELNAQMAKDGMQYVKDALEPKLTPDDRKRIYDYLVLAFEHQSAMREWAKRGLTNANRDVQIYEQYIHGLEGDLTRSLDQIDRLTATLAAQVAEDKGKCRVENASLNGVSQQLLATREAITKIKEGLEPSDPVQLNLEALKLERRGLLKEATAEYERACKLGYPTACFNLAMRLHRASGVTIEEKRRAAELYESSCERHVPSACTNGGDLMVMLGDEGKARTLYGKGCESGDRRGCEEAVKHRPGPGKAQQ